MKTFWSFNGSGNNAKKILENQLLRTQYCIPLDDYKKNQEDFMKRYNLRHMNYSWEEFVTKVSKRIDGKSWITGGSLLHFNICGRYTVSIPKDDPILSFEKDDTSDDATDINTDKIYELFTEYCFYKATQLSEEGLAAIIELACSDASCSEHAEELLEKIILADYSDINEYYTPTFLLLVANCLMGEYSFNTMRNYTMAKKLYQVVIDNNDSTGDINERLSKMAERRINCCKLMSSTKLNPPDTSLLKKIDEDSINDDLSGTLLAFYYLTAGDYYDEAKYELGMQYLNSAISNNYRPALYLFRYLGEHDFLKKYDSEKTEDSIKKLSPKVIDPLLAG